MKTILIIGYKGQLGTSLSDLFLEKKINFIGKDLPGFDLTAKSLEKDIDLIGPNIIINCAAYNNVYIAENEPEKAFQINGYALKPLAKICKKNTIYLCHISTDYVFNGTKKEPYIESDMPNPINMYGLSKYIGEKTIQNNCDKYSIIRTAALYGNSINGNANIVDKLISIARKNDVVKLVSNEYTSPTFTDDLAFQILKVIQCKMQGIIHASSEGFCNWVDFGKLIFDIMKIKVKKEEVKPQELYPNLKKPLFSVLENSRLKADQLNIMPHWKDSIIKYLSHFSIN